MKSLILTIARREPAAGFQIHRLGLHEKMAPAIIDRPEGTRDYLFMLFHSEVRVKSREGETVWPSPGLMIWTPADGHYYGNTEGVWDHSWFHCSGREIDSILKLCAAPVRQRIAVTDPSPMEHFLLEATAELSGWNRPDSKILRNLFENFLRALVRQALHKTERLAPPGLLAIRSHVEQHFTEKLRLGDLARRVGWSEPHLCSEFRRFFGIPVIQFVQQLRMNHACYLLRDHNRRIGEVAYGVGYSDLYTFSKMFKHYMGFSPKKFRELNFQEGARAGVAWTSPRPNAPRRRPVLPRSSR
jgi:AraC family transcriptional regulator of arabinose operon